MFAALLMPLLQKLLPYIIAGAVAFFAGCFLTHKVDDGVINGLKAEYATAQAKAASAALAKQQRFDDDAHLAAQQDQVRQLALSNATQTYQQRIVRYVPKATPACVPVGLVSVLRSAIGVSVDSPVPNAAVKSDDACSTVRWPNLAAAVIDAFGRARANGAQLDALEGFINQAKKDNAK